MGAKDQRVVLRAVPAVAPRALGYVRVSKERDDMTSPEIQATAIRDHCARNGYELIDIIEDLDLSGRFWKRRQVENAIARVESGEAEVIVVWKISRVARDPRRLDWNIAVDRVESAGGRMESATEQFDTSTSSGRFARGILAELAAFESERIGETWRETHERRIRAGLPHSGRKRFGYDNDKNRFWPNSTEAPIVKEMFSRFLSGSTYRELMLWLEPMQLGTMTTHKSISDYMDSGFAAGWITHHNLDCPLSHRDGAKNCKNKVRSEGAQERIVDRETYDAYLTERNARRTVPPRLKPPGTTFSGVVYCTACGWRYTHHSRANGGKQYRCGNTKHCPAGRTVAKSRLESAVLEWLPVIAGRVEAAAGNQIPSNAIQIVERERLERVVIEADKALTQLAIDLARKLIPESAFVAARDQLISERDKAAVRSAQLEPRGTLGSAHRKVAANLLDAWPDMTDEEKNKILRDLAVIHIIPERGAPGIVIYEKWKAPELERLPARKQTR